MFFLVFNLQSGKLSYKIRLYDDNYASNIFNDWTRDTFYTIPDGILSSGETYLFRVTADDPNNHRRSSTFSTLNYGIISNSLGDTLTNSGTLVNMSEFINKGDILGSGNYLQTAGQGTNTGAMTQGSIDIQGGSFTANGTITVSDKFTNSGLLTGSGTINGDVENFGTVNPGSSPGKLTINGDFVQDFLGKLSVELGGYTQGADYDWLCIDGNAQLAGELDISFYDDFTPKVGDIFSILTTGGVVSGSFDPYIFENSLGLSSYWDIGYGKNFVNIEYLGTTNPVPEPATMILFGTGLAGLIGVRLRKKKK